MFRASEWPLHATIVPPFETDLDADAVAALVPQVQPIPVVGGERARFGARRTVPVTVLRDSLPLQELHTALVEGLEAAGVELRDQRHLKSGYRAHVSDQQAHAFHPGQRALIDEIAVVDREPHGMRRVAARVRLLPAP